MFGIIHLEKEFVAAHVNCSAANMYFAFAGVTFFI